METITFDLLLEGVPYFVKAKPYAFNSEPRFQVTYNDGPEYIFAWDENVSQYTAIGDESATIPADVEEAIGTKLLQLATSEKG